MICRYMTSWILPEWYPIDALNRALFSDGGDTAGRSGHDRARRVPSRTIGLFTTVFVLAVKFTRDDAMSGEDQGPSVTRLTRVIVDDGGL